LDFWLNLKDELIRNFITGARWKYLADGLLVTLRVSFFAVLIGIAVGVVLAIIRSTHDLCKLSRFNPFLKFFINFFDFLSKLYLNIIRGTPTVIQLLIMYYVIFASVNIDKTLVAVLAFGINSSAYVAEIIRSGIMSIDRGQMEAGRSLGLNYVRSMVYIVLPQAFKNVLPSLGNEFIVLLKETSICGYIALQDLTRGAYIIRGITYSAFMPLIAAAVIYLVMVLGLDYLMKYLERRLRRVE
jgi:His/Glu/Gln/Arg/opine family amino acid ABC transporter permease subunit